MYDSVLFSIVFFGTARKSFKAESMNVNSKGCTVQELLDHLVALKPRETPDLDTKNLLVVINGVDSSAQGAGSARIRAGDTVTIIPVVHGGSGRTQFEILGDMAEVLPVSWNGQMTGTYLDDLRKAFPSLVIQAVSKKYVLSVSHIRRILAISMRAAKRGILISRRLETDILMRFAGSTQISKAISRVGMKKGSDFIVVAIGAKESLDGLFLSLQPVLGCIVPLGEREFIMREFGITQVYLDAMDSNIQLEDALVERAAILF